MLCELTNEKITLIDYFSFIKEKIDKNIIDMCYDHQLIKKQKIPLTNSDVQKIILHHLILELCNLIADTKSNSCVFCITQNDVNLELDNFIVKEKLRTFFNKAYKKINKNMPIVFVEVPYININKLCDDLNLKNGNAIDTYEIIKRNINKKKNTQTNLSEAKKFTKFYNLHFLNRTYLNKLNIKLRLCTK